jgi:hypothetical protein
MDFWHGNFHEAPVMRRLQEFGFEKSAYERPNQKWICGRARDGQCCLAGPDAHGHCTATAECRPLRKGDHWHCTRPALLGGPCADGPLPDGQCCRVIPKCSPVRSLRAWRGIAVLLTVAATLAGLLLAFGSNHGNRFFSPGDLSFSHRFASDNCSQCHGPLKGPPAGWLAAGAVSISAHDNSGLCLNCHPLGEAPLQPHSLAPAHLAPLTQSSLKKNGARKPPASLAIASFISSVGRSGDKDVACATCHKEHRGEEADLKKLTNVQCQNCHAAQFASLAVGHPAFTHYPFERRTRIIFDHAAHINTHFKDPKFAKVAPGCQDCHQTDLRGGTMLLKPFEIVCASCHDAQIKGNAGIAFIRIPPMDDRALTGDYAIGQWPQDADQQMPPLMRTILSGDPKLREAMKTLAGSDLSDLSKADSAKLKAAQTLAWGIKSLIFDLETRGQVELITNINLATGGTLNDYEKEGVVALLSADAVRATFSSIFTNLQNEVLDYRNNARAAATLMVSSTASAKPGPVKPLSPDAWVSQGGWYSPDGSFTLFYHPRGHSDRFLSSWMNLTVDADRNADPASSRALFKELSAPTAAGRCGKCHSIDDTPAKHVNWTASRPDPLEHGFNHFSHAAHLSLMDATGCQECHPMNVSDSQSKDSYASAFDDGQHNPAIFHSNFPTINKDVCVRCHKPGLVRDDCLLCHDYHIGRFKPLIPGANVASAFRAGGK